MSIADIGPLIMAILSVSISNSLLLKSSNAAFITSLNTSLSSVKLILCLICANNFDSTPVFAFLA